MGRSGVRALLPTGPPPPAMEERARAAWEREAAALRSEIARLEREGREDDAGQGDADSDQRAALTRAMEVLTRQSGPGERWDEEKQQGPTMETRHSWLESRLEFLSELTGIHFHSYTWSKEMGVQGAVGKHMFSGECFSFSFQLQFELNETTVDGQTTASVSQLDVAVDSAPDDLANFIARAEEEKSLMLLLRTIVSHSRWCALRQKTFAHFKEGKGPPPLADGLHPAVRLRFEDGNRNSGHGGGGASELGLND
ncbi:unnamed protein product [Lampetra fluviatilis]